MSRRSSAGSSSSGSCVRTTPTRQPPKQDHRGPSLKQDDVHTSLVNMMYPRSCETLNTLGHELKPLQPYPGVFRLKSVYSIKQEKKIEQYTADMIAKLLPETIEMQRLYSRELTFYRYLEPQLHHVMVQTMQSPIPRCFLARGECEPPAHRNPSMPVHRGPPDPGCNIEGENSVLVTQDLGQEGLRSAHNATAEMDFPHCASAMSALACFHAASAVLDRCDPKLKRGSYLKTAFPFLVPEHGMFSRTEELFDRGMKIIGVVGPHMNHSTLLPGRDVCKIIRFMNEKLNKELLKILKPHRSQLNTLCHGNCMNSSNFLFTQDHKHRPVVCKLIGLRQVRYCRPAVDLSLVLYCAANKEVRTNQVHELLDVYRDEFNKVLERCQRKHHVALPFSAGLLSMEQLQKSMEGTKLLGVALRAMVVATQFHSNPSTNRMSLEDAARREFLQNATYRVQVTEAVSDLLAAVEPYAGNCMLSSNHSNCPHHLPTKVVVPPNPDPDTPTPKAKERKK